MIQLKSRRYASRIGQKIDHLIMKLKKQKMIFEMILKIRSKRPKNKKEKIEEDINEYKDSENGRNQRAFLKCDGRIPQSHEAMITSLKK